jgi:ATP phosphoribosyltransferase regulatory subunit HisZ
MRLLQKQGYKWQILQPWDVQPSLSHHALVECICEHALQKPHFRKSLTSSIQAQTTCDVGALHDETEAVFMQLLAELPRRGVENMQLTSLKQLWRRCDRHLSKHRQDHPVADLQLQLVLAYLFMIEVWCWLWLNPCVHVMLCC